MRRYIVVGAMGTMGRKRVKDDVIDDIEYFSMIDDDPNDSLDRSDPA